MKRRQFIGAPLAAAAATAIAGFATVADAAPQATTERLSVLDFIPSELHAAIFDESNTVDLTAYIQAAIDSRPGRGIELRFPSGAYRFNGILRVLRSHLWLRGDNATLVHGAEGDAIVLGDAVAAYSRIQVSGFLMGKALVCYSGAMIRSRSCSIVTVKDCYFYGDDKIHDVMVFERGYQIHIHNVVSEKCRNNHVTLSGTGPGADRQVDATIYDNRFDYGVSALSANGFVEGIFFRRNICLRQRNIIVSLNGTPAWTIASVKIQENDFDGGGSIGLQINRLSNFQINDNWFSSLQDTPLRIDENAGGGTVNGNQFYAIEGRTAIEIGGQGVVLTGNTISGGQQGMYLRASSGNIVFTGNMVTYMKGSAINLYENPSMVTIVGNNFIGNAAAVSPGGTALNVANNLIR